MASRKTNTNGYDDLTPKQQRFVEYYDGNATAAARKAGYRQPRQVGTRNMSNVVILAAIKSRESRKRKDTIATREDRQEFWSKVMKDKKEGMSERLRASDLLGKSEADFTENMNIRGNLRVNRFEKRFDGS